MEINYYCYNKNNVKRMHIGKKSDGWAFAFQLSNKLPWSNLNELKAYLKNDDVVIIDEKDCIFTADEFWNDIVGESLYPHEGYYDINSYIKEHPEEFELGDYYSEKIIDGARWVIGGFC